MNINKAGCWQSLRQHQRHNNRCTLMSIVLAQYRCVHYSDPGVTGHGLPQGKISPGDNILGHFLPQREYPRKYSPGGEYFLGQTLPPQGKISPMWTMIIMWKLRWTLSVSAYIVIINVLCIIKLMFITLLANLVVTKLNEDVAYLRGVARPEVKIISSGTRTNMTAAMLGFRFCPESALVL